MTIPSRTTCISMAIITSLVLARTSPSKSESDVSGAIVNTSLRTQVAGGKVFSDSTEAQPGDYINFSVFLGNAGRKVGVRPTITIDLDPRLHYVPNTSAIHSKVHNKMYISRCLDKLIAFKGHRIIWGLVDMAPDRSTGIYLEFQTRLSEAVKFAVGKTTVRCRAEAAFQGTKAYSNSVTVVVARRPKPVASFLLRSEVRNVTIKGLWNESISQMLSASPGDTLEFWIRLTNVGNADASNIVIKDIVPKGLTLVGQVKVHYEQHKGSSELAREVVESGLILHHIRPGSIYGCDIWLSAIVDPQWKRLESADLDHISNRVRVLVKDQVVAQASTGIFINLVRSPLLTLEVLDPVDNSYKKHVSLLHRRQRLTYRATVLNNTEETLVDPVLRVMLPPEITYVADTVTFEGVNNKSYGTALFAQGILLTSCYPGMVEFMSFEATTNDDVSVTQVPITTVAYMKATGKDEQQSSAVAAVSDH